ncbi:collagen alpha-1(I) chain-like [Dipodomys spectabilis]|uniref:collagen alpha-1(I) chain-like n=1 Tax=Dipodomys spectabilis TaxID=105255 RepID=UPI001C54106E|nr:collagen alpha-1(I) chain-like [Dipodomys spectabilis]
MASGVPQNSRQLNPGSPHPPSGKSKIGVTVSGRLPPPRGPRRRRRRGHWLRIGGSENVDAATAGRARAEPLPWSAEAAPAPCVPAIAGGPERLNEKEIIITPPRGPAEARAGRGRPQPVPASSAPHPGWASRAGAPRRSGRRGSAVGGGRLVENSEAREPRRVLLGQSHPAHTSRCAEPGIQIPKPRDPLCSPGIPAPLGQEMSPGGGVLASGGGVSAPGLLTPRTLTEWAGVARGTSPSRAEAPLPRLPGPSPASPAFLRAFCPGARKSGGCATGSEVETTVCRCPRCGTELRNVASLRPALLPSLALPTAASSPAVRGQGRTGRGHSHPASPELSFLPGTRSPRLPRGAEPPPGPGRAAGRGIGGHRGSAPLWGSPGAQKRSLGEGRTDDRRRAGSLHGRGRPKARAAPVFATPASGEPRFSAESGSPRLEYPRQTPPPPRPREPLVPAGPPDAASSSGLTEVDGPGFPPAETEARGGGARAPLSPPRGPAATHTLGAGAPRPAAGSQPRLGQRTQPGPSQGCQQRPACARVTVRGPEAPARTPARGRRLAGRAGRGRPSTLTQGAPGRQVEEPRLSTEPTARGSEIPSCIKIPHAGAREAARTPSRPAQSVGFAPRQARAETRPLPLRRRQSLWELQAADVALTTTPPVSRRLRNSGHVRPGVRPPPRRRAGIGGRGSARRRAGAARPALPREVPGSLGEAERPSPSTSVGYARGLRGVPGGLLRRGLGSPSTSGPGTGNSCRQLLHSSRRGLQSRSDAGRPALPRGRVLCE